jgi:hypothetical protein
MDEVADLEFGPSQKLTIGLGGEQLGDGAEIGLGGLEKGLEDPLGLFCLLGVERNGGGVHEKPP